MALFSISNIRISGVTAAVPSQREQNDELEGFEKEECELLINTTGIRSRRVAPQGLCASDLCYQAAQALLAGLSWNPSEIDLLVMVTQTPDYQLPGNSILLQERLGLRSECMTLDLHQGCAGYVYGLSQVSALMNSAGMKKALLLVGDTITHLLDPKDKGTIPIFSDAGTATALEFHKEASPIYFHLQSTGVQADAIRMEGSGTRRTMGDAFMRMRGHDIFTFGLKEVAPNVESLLDYAGVSKEHIDYFIFHQANRLLNESIRKKLKLAPEKVPYSLQDYGNTSCATIPLTWVHALRDELQENRRNIVLSGFGVGLSWGSVLLSAEKVWSQPIIEV